MTPDEHEATARRLKDAEITEAVQDELKSLELASSEEGIDDVAQLTVYLTSLANRVWDVAIRHGMARVEQAAFAEAEARREAREKIHGFARGYLNPHGVSAFALCEIFEALDRRLADTEAQREKEKNADVDVPI